MPGEPLIGTSAVIQQLELDISDAASSDAKVLLTGESGVGKEVVARLIHERSRRRSVKLVAINCAAVPDSLLESELFGHVRGSFTGAFRDKPGLLELAHSGTIFLDEIGETSLRMQALMLRFLENGEIWRIGSPRPQHPVDVRIIAATNQDLAQQIARGAFRADLYFRLNVLHLRIPPLRDRREDISAFIDHFLHAYSAQHAIAVAELTPGARAMLTSYDWPGNVRELKNVIERLVVRRRSGAICEADLPDEVARRSARSSTPSTVQASAANPTVTLAVADQLYERLVSGGESFWSSVYPLFMARDITREDLRAIVRRGLIQTRGNYRQMLQLFNMPAGDYKPFLTFLSKYQCKMPFLQFRCLTTSDGDPGADAPRSTR